MHIALPAHAPRTRFLPRVWAALTLHRQRRALLALDQHMLNDIGLTRHQADAEAARPVWDAPQIWRQ
jgi:uncharacterized protein YjiS (DUF1127 family)